jgi:hypothetical protein
MLLACAVLREAGGWDGKGLACNATHLAHHRWDHGYDRDHPDYHGWILPAHFKRFQLGTCELAKPLSD